MKYRTNWSVPLAVYLKRRPWHERLLRWMGVKPRSVRIPFKSRLSGPMVIDDTTEVKMVEYHDCNGLVDVQYTHFRESKDAPWVEMDPHWAAVLRSDHMRRAQCLKRGVFA